jgi:hypothetical protein
MSKSICISPILPPNYDGEDAKDCPSGVGLARLSVCDTNVMKSEGCIQRACRDYPEEGVMRLPDSFERSGKREAAMMETGGRCVEQAFYFCAAP